MMREKEANVAILDKFSKDRLLPMLCVKNPYDPDTPEYGAWQNGFTASTILVQNKQQLIVDILDFFGIKIGEKIEYAVGDTAYKVLVKKIDVDEAHLGYCSLHSEHDSGVKMEITIPFNKLWDFKSIIIPQ